MSSSSPANTESARPARAKRLARFLLRFILFLCTAVLILFPRVDLLGRQVMNWFNMDALIMPGLPEIARMNQEIDSTLPAGAPPAEEIQAVEKYVMKHIIYTYDWDQWWNTDYWPNAAEVCRSGKEDCDGRAVLAVSLLRARGYPSAALTGNLNHMWASVIPRKGAASGEALEIMQPDAETNLHRSPDGTTRISLPGPSVIRGLFAGLHRFPAWRLSLLLASALLFLCSPRRSPRLFWPLLCSLLLAQIMIADWALRSAAKQNDTAFIAGLSLLIVTLTVAALRGSRQNESPLKKN